MNVTQKKNARTQRPLNVQKPFGKQKLNGCTSLFNKTKPPPLIHNNLISLLIFYASILISTLDDN